MDQTLLNSGLLWSSPQKIKKESESWNFIFDWFNLNDGVRFRLIESNHDDVGSIAYETFNSPRSDGGSALSKYYRTKTINLTIVISWQSEEELNDAIDDLKLATSKMEWFLDITINGIVRRWKATLTGLKFNRRSYNVDFLQNVQLSFSCVDPIAFAVNPMTETFSQVSWMIEFEISYTWKVSTDPTIYLIMNQALWLNEINIETNWFLLNIQKVINTGDVITIDGESKLVKVNWTAVVYSWPFPIMESWINHFSISMNEESLTNYDAVIIYQKKFI